ncbi:MAG: type II toxin-antitoxin system HicB family antitoxin [Calditrichaeota bacterium]|nr:MAG: type II toxin-antitoxin system HicB family antitoxin [Calditrichota bacterium]
MSVLTIVAQSAEHAQGQRIWKEGAWYIAQCIEVDVVNQGKTKDGALANLREALELHFEEPRAPVLPEIRQLEVEVCARI